ncbi:MAG: universal stress protein [Candidatus Brocadiaceae bacterium]
MKHIVVTTDFSTEAESAFDYAKELVQLIGKDTCNITLLKVIDEVAPSNIAFEFGLAIADRKSMAGKLHKRAEEKIKEIAEKHFAGFSFKTVVINPLKPVYQEIVEFAKTHNVNLIIMSTHGRTGVKHFLLGSVAERVVRQSPCPVVIVPVQLSKGI